MNSSHLLKEYADGAKILLDRMKEINEKMLSYRPKREDAWTIKEHVIHLIDSEINGFVRLKSIIAQPGSTCYVMEEEAWTKNIRRKNEDVTKYLSVFKLIREMVYDLLIDEVEENWRGDYFIRHYHGETLKVTIEKFLEIYINHLKFHLEYLDKNIEEYNENTSLSS